MEIIKVLEELEREVQEASRIPFSSKVVMEEELIYKYIDALRAHIPEDIRQAQWINKEKERIIKETKEEAKTLINHTENKVQELCEDQEIIKIAKKQANDIVEAANDKALKLVQGAYSYVDEIMGDVEKRMDKHLKEVRAGKTEIKSVINKYKMKQGNMNMRKEEPKKVQKENEAPPIDEHK